MCYRVSLCLQRPLNVPALAHRLTQKEEFVIIKIQLSIKLTLTQLILYGLYKFDKCMSSCSIIYFETAIDN